MKWSLIHRRIPFVQDGRATNGLPPLVLRVTAANIAWGRTVQWVAMLVSLSALGLSARWWNDSLLLDETALRLESVGQRLSQANSRFSQAMVRENLTLSPDQMAAITQEVRFVNQLSEKRSFSWSRLLGDLEATMPPQVALRSVQLNFQDATVSLHGAAPALQDVNSFMTRLEQHEAFRHAALASHRLEQQTSQQVRQPQAAGTKQDRPEAERGVEFQMTVVYRPSF